MEQNKKIKLNIGCINWKPGGYIHIDIHDHKISKFGALDFIPLDIVADARNLPFSVNSVDEIFTDRMIEHIPICDVQKMFNEFYRVLKFGGILDVGTVDIKIIFANYLKYETMEDKFLLIRQIYGGQDKSLADFDFHRCGFDEDILRFYMREAGFVNIIRDFSDGGIVRDDINYVGLRMIGYKLKKEVR